MTDIELRLERIRNFRAKLESGLIDKYILHLHDLSEEDINDICLDLKYFEYSLRKEIGK